MGTEGQRLTSCRALLDFVETRRCWLKVEKEYRNSGRMIDLQGMPVTGREEGEAQFLLWRLHDTAWDCLKGSWIVSDCSYPRFSVFSFHVLLRSRIERARR